MAGRYVSEIEIKAKTDQAEKDILNIQELVDELKKHEYKVNIGADSQKLEKVIGSLEKMLDSLGKGTGDFKQFENLSKELSDVISEVQSLSKAFGKVDDSGTKTLLSSIQSIDKSLSDLSQHIIGVNADFGSIGKNASDNVGQINEAKKATEGLTDATKDLAKAQQNLNGNKSNISSGDSSATASVIDIQNKLQDELKQTQKQAEKTADGIFVVFRGLKSSTDEFFDTKNQSAWFSDNLKSAKSFARYSNDNLYKASIKIDNPMIVDANGADHDNIIYTETVEELQKAIQLQEELNKKREEFNSKYGDYLETQDSSYLDDVSKYLKATDEIDGLEEKLKSYIKTSEELQKIAKDNGHDGLIIKNVNDNFFRTDHNIGTSYAVFNKKLILSSELLKEQEVQAEITSQAIQGTLESNSTMKDVFQNDSTSSSTAKEEASVMEQVETATEQAVQAKKDFATANEGVQNSVADSKSLLQLEAELMQQIAKDARDAADAKKEFVEANKQVKDSTDDSNEAIKRGHSENAEPSGTKKYKKKGYRAHDAGNHDNEVTVTKKSELGKVLKDLQTEIIASLDETTSFIKEVTDFYDSADNLVKTQMKVVDKDGSQRTYTTSYSTDKDGNATAWTSHIDTSNYEKQAKAAEQEAKSVEKANRAYEQQIEKAKKLSEVNKKHQETERQSTVNSALKQQESAWKNIQSIREKIAKADPKDEAYISLLKETKIEYQKQYIEAGKVLKANQDIYDSEKQVNKLKQIQLETDAKISKYKASQKASTVSSFQSSIDSYQSKLTEYSNRPPEKQSVEYKGLLTEYRSQLVQLKTRFGELSKEKIISEDQISSFNKLKKQLDTTDLKFQNVFKGDDFISVKKEIDTITKYMSKNTRISSEAKDKLRGYIEELKTNGADANVKAIHAAFLDVCDGERKAKREGQSFLDVLRDKVWYQWAAQIGSYFSFNDILRYAKEGIQTVRELDTALAEMRKVSDESASSLKRVQDASFDLANEVGTTALQIQNSIADFMRIGDSVEEAQKHALDANTLLQVSEFDNIEDATSALVSMSKAWDDIDTKHINDVLNILGNNMPIATDELASSLQRSAGTLATLGATIEEAAALTVAGNSILQDPDSVAAGELLPEYIVICRYFNIPESSYIG